MNEEKTVKLGDILYADIENNDYLNELYKNILYNYAIQTMHITHIKQARGINIKDALRFADILSKSTHPENADKHKIWACDGPVVFHVQRYLSDSTCGSE